MKLDFIELGKLSVSRANMRYSKKAPDVSDILPTIRARGIVVPVLVRPSVAAAHGSPDTFEIVAGARRFHAASLVAAERQEAGQEVEPMPCAILESGDDADAVEASLIENRARLDPDEVTCWESFTRLVKEGRDPADIAQTFGLPDLAVKRILALGNLMPRIRDLYRQEKIDPATVRHLTMASKSQQRAWLALLDDPEAYCPTGHQLKAWLFGGKSIAVKHALFDPEGVTAIVADLFGEDRYFADSDAFWKGQNEAIAARRDAYLEEGWSDVVTLPVGEHFRNWEHVKAPKRRGGRVYIEVRDSGEATFHEGYITAKEARRLEKGEAVGHGIKAPRSEITGTTQTYIDLHRHAALRAALTGYPAVAMRLMVAHAIAGSSLWSVRLETQATRNDAIRESVECSNGETCFDMVRRDVLAMLGMDADDPTVAEVGNGSGSRLVVTFSRMLALDDPQVMTVLAVVMGETLASGSAIVELLGQHIGLNMAENWQADDAFFEGLRDREVLLAILAEVAGATVASANAGEKTKVLKSIIRGHREGADGREWREGWVPRWMTFPPAAYTTRGGVGTVDKAEAVAKALAGGDGPDADAKDEDGDDLDRLSGDPSHSEGHDEDEVEVEAEAAALAA
ncbi:ParB N-terminal domain-containing protein [Novosphingobium sp.]|uniref:ParB/RepB/Spo0J family partition protein n=1 Tax=Novosphingobium sp. TaxID=1874826 RepID=UPI0031D1C0CD